MPGSRWLLLDIGNTHTVAGVYEKNARAGDFPVARARFRTDPEVTPDEYRVQLDLLFAGETGLWNRVERVIVSTVVPALEPILLDACAPVPVLFVKGDTRREFELDLPQPEQLGADRLANVAGALALAKPPFLIVDAGTATTFCLVDARPAYVGGAITPGLEIGWKALQSRAAKLFSVELIRPASPVGRTTETQIQSGVLNGYEALIDGMSARLAEEAGPAFAGATWFATGGCLRGLKLGPRFRVEPDLTLMGLLRYGQLTR
jgi:type III pantothenate kinase